MAALVLRYHGASEDKTLLQQAVALDPHSIEMWSALASYGKLRPQEQALARATYQNTKLPKINRIHAGVALASSDEKVAASVVQELRDNLAAIEKINILEATEEMGKLYASTEPVAGEKARELLKITTEYFMRLHTLAAVRHLQLPNAQDLVFTFLEARDMEVRSLGTMIAVERYPARFLKILDRKRYPNQYDHLCALLALWHPQLKGEVLEKLPATKLNASIKRIQTQKMPFIILPL